MKAIISIIGVILIGLLLIVLVSGIDGDGETASTNADQNTTSSEELHDTSDATNWLTYTGNTEAVEFSFEYPPAATVSQVQSAIFEVTYVGPDSKEATEITDGYTMSMQFMSADSLGAYVAEADPVMATTAAEIAGYDALTYETESQLGNTPVTHIAEVVGESEGAVVVLDLGYSARGSETAQMRYQQEIRRVIRSLSATFNTPSESSSVPDDVQAQIDAVADRIRVTSPEPGSSVTNPITFSGEAVGPWYFEASFPVMVVNWDGLIIGEGIAEAKGAWMTEDFVPFSGTIEYERNSNAPSNRGTLIFHKSNPSGLPENDAALEIPIQLE